MSRIRSLDAVAYRLASRFIRLVAIVVPAELRARWTEEWHGELWHRLAAPAPGRRWRRGLWPMLRRCLGAPRDALAARSPQRQDPDDPRSPRSIADSMLNDVRYALRNLRLKPGFTAVAVTMLALGLGANAAIFSVAHAVLISPLPFPDPERLVRLYERRPHQGRERNTVSIPDFVDWRAGNRSFEHMAAYQYNRFNLVHGELPEAIAGARINADFFEVLGIEPALGRDFDAADDVPGGARVVILSHGMWADQLGEDAAVIGRSLVLNDEPYTVVGVLPPGLGFPFYARMWVPLQIDASTEPRGNHAYGALARLREGVGVEEAWADLEVISRRLERDYPDNNQGHYAAVYPLHAELVSDRRGGLLMLLGVAGFVLLIVCANVANMQLARATGRLREIAVRTALGASRARLVRQLLTESTVLACLAALGGLGLATLGVELLIRLAVGNLPWVQAARLDLAMAAFTLALALATILLFGLVPALQGTGRDQHGALNDASSRALGGSRARLRGALVVAEVALALLLVIGAGLLARSFLRLIDVDPGFDPTGLISTEIQLPETRYPTGRERADLFTRLRDDVAALPGIDGVGVTYLVPLTGNNSSSTFRIDGRPAPDNNDDVTTNTRIVDEDYFEVMGIRAVRGRLFSAADRPDTEPVVVINETLARRYWPDEDPIGARLNMRGDRWWTVVGIVTPVRHRSLLRDPEPECYYPMSQFSRPFMSLVISSRQALDEVVAAVRSQLAQIDGTLPLTRIRALPDLVDGAVGPTRTMALLIGLFAAVAILLAAVGIYGVISYGVGQRTQEIGLRMALGSTPGSVLRLVVGEGMRLVLVGVVAGLAAASALARSIAGLLYEVPATDWPTFGIAALLLAGVAGLANLIPARRATRVDPAECLRRS